MSQSRSQSFVFRPLVKGNGALGTRLRMSRVKKLMFTPTAYIYRTRIARSVRVFSVPAGITEGRLRNTCLRVVTRIAMTFVRLASVWAQWCLTDLSYEDLTLGGPLGAGRLTIRWNRMSDVNCGRKVLMKLRCDKCAVKRNFNQKDGHFRACKTFHMKMIWFTGNEPVVWTHFHMNGFAPRLVLTSWAKGNAEMAKACNQTNFDGHVFIALVFSNFTVHVMYKTLPPTLPL